MAVLSISKNGYLLNANNCKLARFDFHLKKKAGKMRYRNQTIASN